MMLCSGRPANAVPASSCSQPPATPESGIEESGMLDIGMLDIGMLDIGMDDIGEALTAVPRGAWLRSMLPIGVAAIAPSVVALPVSSDCGRPPTFSEFAPTRTVE